MELHSRQWSFSVLRAHGLQHIHKDKIWKPIVCISVDCSAGRENHCPTYETVLGSDGQNPNQKEVFLLPNFPRPTSKLTVSVHYRSPSKKKAKKRVLVASCTCSMGELVELQRQEPKPHLRLSTHSNSFSKSSKSPRPSAVAKRTSSSASNSSKPAHRLGHATIQVRLVTPTGLEADKDWRRFGLQSKWSLDTHSEAEFDAGSQSEHTVFGDGEHELVSSPSSSKTSQWPPSPVSPSSQDGESSHHHDRTDQQTSFPSDDVDPHPHQSTRGLRRRRRRRRILTGYNLDDDCDGGEQRMSESCTESEPENKDRVDEGYHSPTPSYHSQYSGDDKDDDDECPSRSQPHENSHRWYTEIIRITATIVDFMPMMDPGILPTFRTRDGVVDVDLADCKVADDDDSSEIDTASVYSNDTMPEQEPGRRGLDGQTEGAGSRLSLASSGSGTLVASSPRPSMRSISKSSGWLKDEKKGKVKDTAEAIGIKTWWEKLLCAFTLYAELRRAGELCGLVEPCRREGEGEDGEDLEAGDTEEDVRSKAEIKEGRRQFEVLFHRLQTEWKYLAGILVALAAVDIAVFAISSDSLIQVNNLALSCVAASSIFTGLGIVCAAWYLLRFLNCDVDTFLSRSFDTHYRTHIFFSLNARIPGLCLFLSTISLLGFLAITAFSTFPIGSSIISFLVGLSLGLGVVVRGVEVVGKFLGRSLKWTGKGVMRVVAAPLNLIGWKAASATASANSTASRPGKVVSASHTPTATGLGEAKPAKAKKSKSRLKLPALLRNNKESQKQKVTEPAKGEEKEYRKRFEKAKTKVKARVQEEERQRDLEKNRDLHAQVLHESLTRI